MQKAALRAGSVAAGFVLFVLALEVLKKGGAGLGPLLRALDVDGLAGTLGFGWLGACVVLSGSPVAAIALALLAAGTLSPREAFAMIGGSRLGASFVVLVVGFLDDLRQGRREQKSAYVGVAALLATAVTYLPALALGLLAYDHGVGAGLRLEGRNLDSIVQALVGPLVRPLVHVLPAPALFVVGVLGLLGAFRAFDRALPELASGDLRVGRVVYRPAFMFLVGLVVTSLTLSVSVSISLLVPLASRGWVRRENLWPYILGANITTFVDTLFTGALVGHPEAVRLVALMMGSVTVVSVPVVFLFPESFGRVLDRWARRCTEDRRPLAVFVAVCLAVPVLLIAW